MKRHLLLFFVLGGVLLAVILAVPRQIVQAKTCYDQQQQVVPCPNYQNPTPVSVNPTPAPQQPVNPNPVPPAPNQPGDTGSGLCGGTTISVGSTCLPLGGLGLLGGGILLVGLLIGLLLPAVLRVREAARNPRGDAIDLYFAEGGSEDDPSATPFDIHGTVNPGKDMHTPDYGGRDQISIEPKYEEPKDDKTTIRSFNKLHKLTRGRAGSRDVSGSPEPDDPNHPKLP